jgi:N-methylhydantoinase B
MTTSEEKRAELRQAALEYHEFPTPGKVSGYPLVAGDVVVMQSAGGGGYGDPLTRDPERVRQDVAAGYVSPARARAGYGVILTPGGEVDLDATRRHRAELTAARRRIPVQPDERDPYEGARGKHRVLRLASRLARELGVEAGDLVELVGRHPAPLRAWVKLDPQAPEGQVPLDGLGRRILGIGAEGAVDVRWLPMPPIPGGLAS